MLLWLLTGTAMLIAYLAFRRARRVSGRLDRLTQSYWELRYEHGQLKARLDRLAPPSGDQAPRQPPTPAKTFVPLSSVRR
jgi:hypothetical protein